jgi:hypothetical protein
MAADHITDLQRAQFVRRVTGTVVTWQGKVDAVTPSPVNDSIIIVSFRPTERDYPVAAFFPSSSEADLAALREGMTVTIQGKLTFSNSGKYALSILEGPTLLAVH